MEKQIHTIEGAHHLVSPTAKLVAYMRAKSDIPYSAQISELTESDTVTKEIFGSEMIEWWMGAMLELRYKSLSELVQREALNKGVTNILELAAGILPRVIIMTEDKNIHYIETDLPDMLAEKKLLVQELQVDMNNRHLDFHSLNVLDGPEVEKIVGTFPDGPVCIINEGLFQYLTVAEKEIAAKNMYSVLKEKGGVWITPDLANSSRIRDIVIAYPEMGAVVQKINSLTQRDFRSNSIGSSEEVENFFKRLGFEIVEYSQKDLVSELSVLKDSSKIDPQKKKMIDGLIDSSKVWVLRAI